MKTTQKKISSLVRSGSILMNEKDYIKAAACFFEAARLGSAEGAFLLGQLYEIDSLKDFIHDDRIAAAFFTKAAEQGHTYAQMHLASLYAEGSGVEKSRDKAGTYWLAAAKSGDPDAQFLYAMFLFFDADDASRRLNAKEASHWLESALEQGVPDAAIALRKIRQWEKDGFLDIPEGGIESAFDAAGL